MKKVLLTTLLSGLMAGTALADLVNWGAVASSTPLHLNGGGAVPSGSIAYVGQFPGGFNFSMDTPLNTLLAAFTRLDTAFVGQDQSGGPPLGDGFIFGTEFGNPIQGFNGLTNAPVPLVPNQPLYIWIFNSADPQTATQWGMVSGGTEFNFSSGGAGNNNIDISLSGAFVPAGAIGQLIFNGADGANELFLGNAPVIPEPSTVALGLAASAALLVIRRRRK